MPFNGTTTGIIVAATLSSILGIWAKLRLVNKKEVFDSKGKALFQYTADCEKWQTTCADRTCQKIGELKSSQGAVWNELKDMNEKYHDISEAIVRIEERNQTMSDSISRIEKRSLQSHLDKRQAEITADFNAAKERDEGRNQTMSDSISRIEKRVSGERKET
jgi:uncharacterized protein (DUF2164 family)